MLRTVTKWIIALYIAQACVGVGAGIAVAVVYGNQAQEKLEEVYNHVAH